MDVLSVGDRMLMSLELIEQVKADQRNGVYVTVRVKEIRRDAEGLVTLLMERDDVQVKVS